MTDLFSAPYQKHSETSREAAEKLYSAENLRAQILDEIRHRKADGRTGDELSEWFGLAPGTISARLIELERAGDIVRLDQTRKTQSNRKAYIYIAKEFVDNSMKILDPVESQRAKNRETIEMAANFLSGLVKAQELKSNAYTKRAQELSDQLNKMLERS